MTREEAIKYLIKPVATSTEIGEEKQKEFEAYDMAITALQGGDAQMQSIAKTPDYMQQIPSEDGSDLISRDEIKALPSADAVHGWRIGKPTEQGEYMVTLDSFGHKYIDLFYYGKPIMPNRKVRGKCWYRSDDEWGDVVYDDTDILAWQPLPKPYKGGDDE